MNDHLITFFQGISATAAWASGLLFFRFFRQSRDSLFAFFGAAFWLLSLSWALLAVFAPAEETRPYIYGVRFAAFLLLIVGIAVKNRTAASRPTG
jgi:hypothetical protein